MKHYLVYKITNNVNNKIYIGQHETDNIDDGYMGSGTVLRRAQEKYGIDNFEKEILYDFSTHEEMVEMEKSIVDEMFVARLDTYNINTGGDGGFWYINTHNLCKLGGQKTSQIMRLRMQNDDYNQWFRAKISNGLKLYYQNHDSVWIGRKHKEESKRKIGEKNSVYQKGSGNSQYGKMWITNGVENKKIKKEDSIPDGWYKGRTGNK